jgi:hypothetical protein
VVRKLVDDVLAAVARARPPARNYHLRTPAADVTHVEVVRTDSEGGSHRIASLYSSTYSDLNKTSRSFGDVHVSAHNRLQNATRPMTRQFLKRRRKHLRPQIT